MPDSSNEIERSVKRITARSLWSDLMSILNFEKGVFYTLKELILRPKKTIETYLKVERSKYANPLRLLVFSTAISSLLSIGILFDTSPESLLKDGIVSINLGIEEPSDSINVEDVDIASLNNKYSGYTLDHLLSLRVADLSNDERIQLSKVLEVKMLSVIMNKVASWMDKFIFLYLPIFALLTYLFFRKTTHYNFVEFLVANAFLVSMLNVFSIVFLIIAFFTSGGVYLISMLLISLIYSIYFWVSVFSNRKFSGVLKSVFVFLFSTILYVLMGWVIIRYLVLVDLIAQIHQAFG